MLLRACSPTETFNKVSPFLFRLGITRVGRQTDLDNIGIPVWCAFTPNARAIVIANGKGVDDESAKTSAVMEAIERSVATQATCPVLETSITELRQRGLGKIDPLDSLLAPSAKPVSDEEVISWTVGHHLLTGEDVHVPHQAVTMDRTIVAPRFWQSSDGLASGNNKTEAILHGLLERIERDALTLWEVTPTRHRYRRRIAVDTASHPLSELIRRIEEANMQIAVFDITSEIGIPVACALLGPKQLDASHLRRVDVTLGAGAGLSLAAAAIRAVTEAAQSRMTFIAGARDDLLPDLYQRPLPNEHKVAFRHEVTTPLKVELPIGVETAETALAYVLAQLQRAGQQRLYSIDLAPPWLPVSVVKVVAPDLENPEGERRSRYGARALSQALQ